MKRNYKNQIKFVGLALFLAFFSLHLFANKTAINPSIESIELLVDSSKTLTLKEIESSSKFEAIKNGYSTPNKAYNYWFRIKIHPEELQNQKHYLNFNASFRFDIECYYHSKDSIIFQKFGLLHKKNIGHVDLIPKFQIITPDSNQPYIYLKSNSVGAAEKFFFNILSENEFHQNQETRQFGLGIFYGILILIMIINIFYFFTLKRKAFLYYAFYVFLTILLCNYLDGIPLFGLMNAGGELNIFLLIASIIGYVGFMPLMTFQYVQLNPENSKLLKTTQWYFIFVIASIISFLFFTSYKAYEFHFLYHNLTLLFGGVLTIIIGIKGFKNNKILSRSFLIAMSIMVLSIILSVLEDYGVTSFNQFYDIVKLGSLLEIIILSFALALYFRDIDRNLVKKSNELDILSNDYEEAREQFSHLEGRFLRSQMNPHFIFNAMSSIQNFILKVGSKNCFFYF